MNKRSSMLLTVFGLLLLGFLSIVVYDAYVDQQKKSRTPSLFSSYPDSGYYKIESKTIISSLKRGEMNTFFPLLEDPNLIESLTDISFSWTQLDFLNIVSALGELKWNDPMSLRNWQIYSLTFEKTCQNDLNGYHFGSISYFKEVDTNEKKIYTTRLIEIYPSFSWVRWGSEASYSKPILGKWKNVNLIESKITAEDALRIAEENGGREARISVENKCLIYVNSYSDNKWEVDYIGADFHGFVDFYTGAYETLNINK